MDKRKLLSIVMRIAQIIHDTCETDEEVEQVKKGIDRYMDFSRSIQE